MSKINYFAFFFIAIGMTLNSCQSKSDSIDEYEPSESFLVSFHSEFERIMKADLSCKTKTRATTCKEINEGDPVKVFVDFPESTEQNDIEKVKTIKTCEDIIRLCHETAAEISLNDSINADCSFELSEEKAEETISPLISASRSFLYDRGFSDKEIDEMLKENGAEESDLTFLVLYVAKQELISSQFSSTSNVRKAPQLLDLFVTPAYADIDGISEQQKDLIKGSLQCATRAIGIDFMWAAGTSVCKRWTKQAIIACFKAIAPKLCGPVGAVIAIGSFTKCMYDKNLLF